MQLHSILFNPNGDGTMDITHRLFPQVCIGIGSLSAYGKVMSLLWVIWLMMGPSYWAMRRILSIIVSICTDYGTERLIPDYADCLIDFCLYIGVQVPVGEVPQAYLFPKLRRQPWMVSHLGWCTESHIVFFGMVLEVASDERYVLIGNVLPRKVRT
jgi:hypothetical protein